MENTEKQTSPIKRFIAWYQQQRLILFVLLFPIVLLLWLIAMAKYLFIKLTKGISNDDYISTH